MATLGEKVERLTARALIFKRQPIMIKTVTAERLILDVLSVLGDVAVEVDRLKARENFHGE